MGAGVEVLDALARDDAAAEDWRKAAGPRCDCGKLLGFLEGPMCDECLDRTELCSPEDRYSSIVAGVAAKAGDPDTGVRVIRTGERTAMRASTSSSRPRDALVVDLQARRVLIGGGRPTMPDGQRARAAR